ncbi:MAG: cyclic nucleotide-binding domain-containing protein [Dokdonella sp.]
MSATHSTLELEKLRQSCGNCALHDMCLPAAIDGQDLARLERVVKSRRPLERGDVLFHEGTELPSLFVVRSGSLKTFTTLPEGDVQVLGFHLPGEIIGFDGLSGERHRASAEALECATVCEVPFVRLSEVASSVPGLQMQLYRVMSREFVREQQHPVMMGRKQAMARLALFLHGFAERRRATGLDDTDLTLSMSRQDLANYLGLVVETVSRLFSRLQVMGVLAVERKRVRIVDASALETLAAGEDEIRLDS